MAEKTENVCVLFIYVVVQKSPKSDSQLLTWFVKTQTTAEKYQIHDLIQAWGHHTIAC